MPGEITARELRRLLNYDPDTGLFTWRVSGRGYRGINIGDTAGGHTTHGYIQIGLYRRRYTGHRLAWLWMTGKWPRQIDHINRCGTDNRWSNLRISTQQQNIVNRIYPRRQHDLPPGVHPKRGKFYSRICVDGCDYRLGTFATAAEAHTAYVAALRRAHGKFVPTEMRGD